MELSLDRIEEEDEDEEEELEINVCQSVSRWSVALLLPGMGPWGASGLTSLTPERRV